MWIASGKVRELYDEGDTLRLVATNRVSAFDRPIAEIPHRAEVLNQLSAWWFEKTRDRVPNHFIEQIDAVSSRVQKCTVFPIEVVMRAYLTGSTNTAIWTLYQQGQRRFFDTTLPDGLCKDSPLPTPIVTPTTKAKDHDVPLTPESLKQVPGITEDTWNTIRQYALTLFEYGQAVSEKAGLILVDTKYEFGRDKDGRIVLIDECHTPDSSRYWRKNSYTACLQAGKAPEALDKEVLRLWLKAHCDPYHDTVLPIIPAELIQQVSQHYQEVQARLCGRC